MGYKAHLSPPSEFNSNENAKLFPFFLPLVVNGKNGHSPSYFWGETKLARQNE